MEAVRCHGLTKRYQAVAAVDGLDLSVGEGEVLGLLGPNGSGKTTTLRLLASLVRPTAGKAWVNGHPLPGAARSGGIGALIEEPAFYPWLTGRANLEILALSGSKLKQAGTVSAVIDRVGLSDTAGRKVRTYSQGMRQRLGMAGALMRRPRLLLLDEPTNGMDPGGVRDFSGLIRSLAGEGTTVILSSHLLVEVERVCHRVAVMDRGKLAGVGLMADMVGARRVRVVLHEADQRRAREILAGWAVRADGPGAVVVERADSQDVMAALIGGGLIPREVAAEQGSLEAAFLRLTQPAHTRSSSRISAGTSDGQQASGCGGAR